MNLYKVILLLHMLAFISWMAGLLYLPRLFVYHASARKEAMPMLETMERRLLKIIMTPAMVATWSLGIALASIAEVWGEGWFLSKVFCLTLLSAFHFLLAHWRKQFKASKNRLSQRSLKIANEFPTVILIAILILAIFKPF